MITIGQEEDDQHNKCINSTKRGAHEHHDDHTLGKGPLT